MKIGQIIREKRRARGLTQEQVAQALGVSAPAVSKWEGDLSFPDITLLPRLARLLGTDLNGLLAFQETLSRQEVGDFLHQLAALEERALALTGLFGQWDFEEQSILLHRACLEQDVTAGLAAVAGLLDSLEKPWQPQQDLYAHLPQQDPGPFLAQLRPGILRELRDPAEHRYDFLRREQAFWDMVGR